MNNELLTMDSLSLNEHHPYDLASALKQLDRLQQEQLLKKLTLKQGAEVLTYLNGDLLNDLFQEISPSLISQYLSQLESNDFFELVELLNESNFQKLSHRHALLFDSICHYPQDSAAHLLSKHFLLITPEMTVKETIKALRQSPINQLDDRLFLSEKGKLVGEINTKNLLLKPADTKLSEFMEPVSLKVDITLDQEAVAELFKNYDYWVLPVVNPSNDLLGIINVDDVIDVIVEETDEDISKMSGMAPLEESYFSTSVLDHVKSRIGWLLALMFSASLTGAIISHYEHAFETVPMLVAFIPMLMDTGGNSGSQSSTLIIRGIATHEIKQSDFFKVLWTEIRISAIISMILAIANGVRIYLFYKNLTIALVVSLTLIFTVIIAKIIGSSLPLLAKKLNLDPAVMAAPIITTVVDTCSILCYFTIAMQFFKF